MDIADMNRVLVEGPSNGFPRMIYPLRRLTLTKHCMKFPRGARSSLVRKTAAEFKLQEKWDSTSFAKKMAIREKRAGLNDLDRFKAMISRKNRSFKVRQLAKKIGGGGKAPAKGKADQKPAQKAAPKKQGKK